jgi:putative tryptophan/tyrosine transport system substrate-binding protein
VKRRVFIAALGGAAVAWPMEASAQQPERVRRIGVLMSMPADEPDGQARLTGFLQGLQEFGWTAGRNVRIEYRWAPGEADRRRYAAELVALAPDVILASTSVSVSRCNRQAAPCPLYLRRSLTRSARASSQVWTVRAVTPLASPCTNTAPA